NCVKFTRRNQRAGLNLWLFYSVVYEWFAGFDWSFLRESQERLKVGIYTVILERFQHYRRHREARATIKCAWALRRSGSGRFHRLWGEAGRRIVRLLVRS